jgi:hypothetical protein
MKNLLKPLALNFFMASASILGAAHSAVYAQSPTASAPMAPASEPSFAAQTGRIVDSVTAALNALDLNDDQKTQLTAISARYAPQVRDIANDGTLPLLRKHQRMRALRNAAMSEIVAVLDPVQKAKLSAIQMELRKNVTTLVSKISLELGLNPMQQRRIHAMLLDAHSQASAIFSDTTLSRLEKRQKLVAFRKNLRITSRKILDRPQLARWNSISSQIRLALELRALAWRNSGTLGFGLLN